MKTDQEYIELEKQNDELYDLLEKATAKINELKSWKELYTAGTARNKKVAALEQRINELEEVVELSSLTQLHDYENELALLTKRLIGLRVAVDKLYKSKHVKNEEIAHVKVEIDNVSAEVATKYITLINIYSTCAQFRGKELEQDTIDGLLDNILSVQCVIDSKNQAIVSLQSEINRLKKLVVDYSDNGKTMEELQKQLKMKDELIANLNRKIKSLEGDNG